MDEKQKGEGELLEEEEEGLLRRVVKVGESDRD